MLKTNVRQKGDVTVVDLSGKITMGTGNKVLREVIDEVLVNGARRILLNVVQVGFIDSTGLGELVGGLKTVEGMKGSLRLLCPAGAVYNALSLARLLPVFQVFTDEREAIASFGEEGQEPSEVRQDDVLFERHDHVAVITLNRPRRFNALDRHLLGNLSNAVVAAGHDSNVRAVVITGSGRAFCYGADIEELKNAEGVIETLDRFQGMVKALVSMGKPIVAAVNGFATGAGLDLALACDLRVLSEKAKLASAFVRFGLVPDGGSTHLLQRLVGRGRAYELMATGRPVDAQEALAWGLANRVVPHKEVVPVAREWAEELARGPRRTLGRIKQLLDENAHVELTEALDGEARVQAQALKDCEFKEGLQARLDRRDPDYLRC